MARQLSPLTPGEPVHLARMNAADKLGLKDKAAALREIEKHTQRIGDLQQLLFADRTRALLVVLQGMDSAGKDGAIRKVFDHVNPAGVQVAGFTAPTPLEQAHDYLWRAHAAAPPMGHIGLFNRSYYEDVLVVRVHADELLPAHLRNQKDIWQRRFAQINAFESLLASSGTQVIKFFLHISQEEQKKRFIKRQRDPAKQWKLTPADLRERQHWDAYTAAYEEMLPATTCKAAPWYVVPADHKFVRDYAIAVTVQETLEKMHLQPHHAADPAVLKAKIK